jgi:hypothetical protein
MIHNTPTTPISWFFIKVDDPLRINPHSLNEKDDEGDDNRVIKRKAESNILIQIAVLLHPRWPYI